MIPEIDESKIYLSFSEADTVIETDKNEDLKWDTMENELIDYFNAETSAKIAPLSLAGSHVTGLNITSAVGGKLLLLLF